MWLEGNKKVDVCPYGFLRSCRRYAGFNEHFFAPSFLSATEVTSVGVPLGGHAGSAGSYITQYNTSFIKRASSTVHILYTHVMNSGDVVTLSPTPQKSRLPVEYLDEDHH